MKSILRYIKVKLQNTKDKEETIKAKKTNKQRNYQQRNNN